MPYFSNQLRLFKPHPFFISTATSHSFWSAPTTQNLINNQWIQFLNNPFKLRCTSKYRRKDLLQLPFNRDFNQITQGESQNPQGSIPKPTCSTSTSGTAPLGKPDVKCLAQRNYDNQDKFSDSYSLKVFKQPSCHRLHLITTVYQLNMSKCWLNVCISCYSKPKDCFDGGKRHDCHLLWSSWGILAMLWGVYLNRLAGLQANYWHSVWMRNKLRACVKRDGAQSIHQETSQ